MVRIDVYFHSVNGAAGLAKALTLYPFYVEGAVSNGHYIEVPDKSPIDRITDLVRSAAKWMQYEKDKYASPSQFNLGA